MYNPVDRMCKVKDNGALFAQLKSGVENFLSSGEFIRRFLDRWASQTRTN